MLNMEVDRISFGLWSFQWSVIFVVAFRVQMSVTCSVRLCPVSTRVCGPSVTRPWLPCTRAGVQTAAAVTPSCLTLSQRPLLVLCMMAARPQFTTLLSMIRLCSGARPQPGLLLHPRPCEGWGGGEDTTNVV